jgi:hypothetical protein
MRDLVEGTRVSQVIRRRCECCGDPFTAKRAARRQFFCSSRCRDADRRERNFRNFGTARRGSSAVPRSNQKTQVTPRPYKGTFSERPLVNIRPKRLSRDLWNTIVATEIGAVSSSGTPLPASDWAPSWDSSWPQQDFPIPAFLRRKTRFQEIGPCPGDDARRLENTSASRGQHPNGPPLKRAKQKVNA